MVAVFYDIFIKNKLFDKNQISVFFDFFLSAHSYQPFFWCGDNGTLMEGI